jgi:hypothetical protein
MPRTVERITPRTSVFAEYPEEYASSQRHWVFFCY